MRTIQVVIHWPSFNFFFSVPKADEPVFVETPDLESAKLWNGSLQISLKEGIPKLLAGQIPILVKDNPAKGISKDVECILIDDDFLVRKTWEIAGRTAKIKIRTVETVEEFERISHELDKSARIYIDFHLSGKSGIEISKQLFEQGFANLYIATGMRECDLPSLTTMPWLKGIQGKEPYWTGSSYDS